VRHAYVYIISNKSHRIYVGWTTDLLRRVHEHKTKKYPSSFTARYHFDRLVWFQVLDTPDAAKKRERALKRMLRAEKVALIQSMNPNWLDLTPRLDLLRLLE
jgi:putative endonuclease